MMNEQIVLTSSGSESVSVVNIVGSSAIIDVKNAVQVNLGALIQHVVVYERQGDDLVLILKNGDWIRLENFFRVNGMPVLVGEDAMTGGGLVGVTFDDLFQGILSATVAETSSGLNGFLGLVPLALGGLAFAGAALTGGGTSLDAPAAPTAGDSTNADGTVTISGTAEPGATVTVTYPDGTSGTATVDAAGAYSVTSATPQPQGTVTATATDASGNTGAAVAISYDALPTVDATAPAAPIVTGITDDTGASGDGITRDSRLVFSGIAEAGATVEVFIDGTSIGMTISDSSGSWSLDNSSTVLIDGTYAITATAADASGNNSPVSSAFSVTVDNSAPTIMAMSNDYGTLRDFATLSDSTMITGSTDPGTIVEVFVNGTSIGTAAADATGVWTSPSIDLSSLAVGASVVVSVLDAAENVSTQTITKDNVLYDVATLPKSSGFIVQGGDSGERLGYDVKPAGDVNGDGIDDLIISSVSNDVGGVNAGAAYVIFGKSDGSWGTTTNTDGSAVLDVGTLSASDGFMIQGAAARDLAGYSVSHAGDIDGDGIDDLIVGAIFNDAGGSNAGAAYVIFGKSGGGWTTTTDATGREVLDLANLSSSDGFVIQGDKSNDWTGYRASNVGDINSDGYDDLAVGAPQGDDGGTDAGEVYLIFGKSGGGWTTTTDAAGREVLDLTSLSSSDGLIIQGAEAGELVGAGVAYSTGDVNGDGVVDLLIGGSDNTLGAGTAYAVFGKSGGGWTTTTDAAGREVLDLASLNSSEGFKIKGAASGDGLGRSVSFVGDVNGDGIGDMIVGATKNADGGTDAGAAYVIFGKSGGGWSTTPDSNGVETLDVANLSSADGFVIQGAAAGDLLGVVVSNAGDVNGDGLADLIVGAWKNDDGGTDAGAAYVIFGKSNGNWATTTDAVGRSVLDMAALSISDGFVIRHKGGDRMGFNVSFAGDVNGDGLDDLVVGEDWGDLAGTDNGQAYVIYGRSDFGGIDQVGTSGADWLVGSDSGDQLTGFGGSDVILAHDGDDVIVVPDAAFARIDGGAGTDALVLSGGGVALDFVNSIVSGAVTNIEVIDLTGSGGNTLTLNQQAVLDMSDITDLLIVKGDTDDAITATGFADSGSDQTVGAITYDVYSNGLATLWIDQSIGTVVV